MVYKSFTNHFCCFWNILGNEIIRKQIQDEVVRSEKWEAELLLLP